MAKKDKALYLNRNWLPIRYAYVPSEKAWNAEMKKMGMTYPYPSTSLGHTTLFVKSETNESKILVTFNPRLFPGDIIEDISVFAHEAVHVFQYMCECIGENEPSTEFEAYSIQSIFMDLLWAYSQYEDLFNRKSTE